MVSLPTPLLGPEGYNAEWDEPKMFGEGDEYLHYDREGNPISLRQWVTGYEDASYRILAHDTVGDTCVITVWNGLNPGWGEPKNIFGSIECVHHETDDASYHDELEFETEVEALADHNRRVSELKLGLERGAGHGRAGN